LDFPSLFLINFNWVGPGDQYLDSWSTVHKIAHRHGAIELWFFWTPVTTANRDPDHDGDADATGLDVNG
jgi:hypothetical protein